MTPRKSHEVVRDATPLAEVGPDTSVRVVDIIGGSCARLRLVAMGIRQGVVGCVIGNGGKGPCIFAVQGCRIVLGRHGRQGSGCRRGEEGGHLKKMAV